MLKTPTLTAEEYRQMNGIGTGSVWEARILSESPKEVWLSIPGDPISLNQWTRQHWAKTRRTLLEMTANMQVLTIVHRLPTFERAEVKVCYYFRTNRRRDEGNYNNHKQLLDAMVKANILADDNADVLRLLPPEFRVDKERPRTEVWARSLEDVAVLGREME